MKADRSLALALAGAIIALLFAPAQLGAQSAGGIDPNAGLSVGAGDLNPVLDPQLEISANGQHYKMAVFDGLTYIDARSELQPALATLWRRVSPTVWEFKLRSGVRFSNGDPLTSKDVVFAIRRILEPETKSILAGRIATVQKAEAVDDLTVRISTAAPDPLLPRRVSSVYVTDADAFQKANPRDPRAQFAGTGPFRVVEFQKDQQLFMERVETSWRGRPNLAKIVMRAMPEVSTRVAALQSGQIDVIQNLPADQISPLRASGFNVVHALAGRTCNLMLNTRYGGPLGNPLVRQALNYAIDKESIVKNILHGIGAVAQGQVVGPDGFGHDKGVGAYPYDPGKAKALLAQAGYPSGFSQRFVGSKGIFEGDLVAEQVLVGMLQEVGVKAQLIIEEAALWRANNNNGQHKDMLFTCIQYFPIMDADFVLQLFYSKHPYKWYSNPDFDRTFEESRTILNDGLRLQRLHQLIKIMHDDVPVVFLYQEPVIFGFSKKTQGIQARPDQVLWFDSIRKLR
jgi:peptide/nickel transport system substrate-binding protein